MVICLRHIYKNPMVYVEHQVPHLCHANATGRAAETKGRQGLHPTPCRAASAAPATQQPPAERRRPRDARAYVRPLAEQQVPRLPRNSHRQSGGDQGTPGRTSDSLPRKSYRQGGGDQGTRDGRQRDTGACSRARGSAHCLTPATQKRPAERRRPRDTGRTPEGHRGVQRSPRQRTLSHASHAKRPAERRRPRDRTDARGTPGRTAEPLAVHIVARLPRKATGRAAETRDTGRTPEGHRGVQPSPWQCTLLRACHAKATGRAAETKGHRRDARGTPGRTSDPLAAHIVSRPATQKPPAERQRPRDTGATPEGHRGVHPTRWQCTLSHDACHAKAIGRAAETKGHRSDARGTPGRTSDPLAVHIVPRLPRKRDRRPRDASGTPADTGAYIRPRGRAHGSSPAMQKRRETKGRQRDTGAYIRPRGSAHCPTLATQKRPETKGRQRDTGGHRGVHPTPCTLSHACE